MKIKEQIKDASIPISIILIMICLFWGPIYLIHLDDKSKPKIKDGFGDTYIVQQYGEYGVKVKQSLLSRSTYYSWDELKIICPNSIKEIDDLKNKVKNK